MTQTTSQPEPWYVHLRSEASANLLLVKIPGIRIEQNKRTGPDMLIYLPDSNGNETSRLMMVEVKATAFPVFQRDGLPKLPKTHKKLSINFRQMPQSHFAFFTFLRMHKKASKHGQNGLHSLAETAHLLSLTKPMRSFR